MRMPSNVQGEHVVQLMEPGRSHWKLFLGAVRFFFPLQAKTLIPSLLRGSLPSEHKWALPLWDIPEHSYIPTGCNSWLLSELSLASDYIGGRDKTAPWRTELWQAPDRCMPIVSAPAFRFRLVWGAWGIRYLLLKDARSDFLHCLNTICRRYSV